MKIQAIESPKFFRLEVDGQVRLLALREHGGDGYNLSELRSLPQLLSEAHAAGARGEPLALLPPVCEAPAPTKMTPTEIPACEGYGSATCPIPQRCAYVERCILVPRHLRDKTDG